MDDIGEITEYIAGVVVFVIVATCSALAVGAWAYLAYATFCRFADICP